MTRPKKLPDRDTLYRLYVVEGLTTTDIAQRYGASPTGVRRALEQAGIPRTGSHRRLTAEQVAEIQRLFDAGVAQAAIAARVGVTQGTVSNVARRNGWTRPRLQPGPKAKKAGN